MSIPRPDADVPHAWQVSVKGIVLDGDHVLLARNDRDQWELPGGRLEPGETPEQCVAREIREETGIGARAERILDSYVFEVLPGRRVLVITYACRLTEHAAPTVSAEHTDVRFVPLGSLNGADLPEGYRRSIEACVAENTGARS